MEEEKSLGNETGSFPFGKGSDLGTFARASKERSMDRTPESDDKYNDGKLSIYKIIITLSYLPCNRSTQGNA
jgi:hypothetical protein